MHDEVVVALIIAVTNAVVVLMSRYWQHVEQMRTDQKIDAVHDAVKNGNGAKPH